MVLDVCAKCGLQQNSGSPDMGPFVTPKRLFRLFLENFSLDFANYLSEWGFYGTRCVCIVSRPEKNLVLQTWGHVKKTLFFSSFIPIISQLSQRGSR